jgi:ankyrin repeat protein
MDLFFKAAEQNDLVQVKEFIDSGVDINVKDKYGYSALHIASTKQLNEMAILLIDQGIDVNMQDKNGYTILHYAALNNQLTVATAALNMGASLSIADIHGNEPLWTAVFNDKGRNDRIEMVQLFLKHGADVNHKNKVGKSPKDIVTIAGYSNLMPLMN